MKQKQFAIIGMGRFGSSVAFELTRLGFEVLAIDRNEERIQDFAERVTHAVSADTTDEEALKALGIRNFDVVVVAIGEDIQASIMTTLILKELGVPRLVVKAQNELHGKVLEKIGADKVVYPERDMGHRLANQLISGNVVDFIELADDYSIVEMTAPQRIVGHNLMQLNIRAKYKCNVLAIKSNKQMNITPYPEDIIHENDLLIIVGKNEDLKNLELDFAEG